MKDLDVDELELKSRRAFLDLTDADLARLAGLRPFAEKCTDAIVDQFYELLLGPPETRRFLPDQATVRRLKRTQREYFLGLFSGKCDLEYVEDRQRVGRAHERIGLSTKWYLGAYRKYLELIENHLRSELTDPDWAGEAFQSIQKLVFFDVVIAIDTYVASKVEAIARHQAAIRELSTPVIQVYDRVLLLPLVGTVDSHRANQVMESVLQRASEAQARCIIIDIAGVPVVDTKVADSIVKMAAALRLLGTEVIVSGISASIARTLVHLGVDLSTMHTVSRLAEGIELALSRMGKAIRTAPKGTNRFQRRASRAVRA
jgi:rsbT co-antagonist protein RsbR